MAHREVTFADLGRDPEAVARELLTWRRGDRTEAIGQTLAASARETHGRGMTVWVWTGHLADGAAVWVLPVTVRHAQAFAPQGPARVLVALLAAAIDAGADPGGLVLRDWHGWVAAEAPGATLGQQLYVVRRRAKLSAQETANGAGLTADLLDAIEAEEIPTDDEAARIKELLAALGG